MAKDKHKHSKHDDAKGAKVETRARGGLAELHPFALTAGGLALGVVAGALLPRSERERALLKPVGERIGGAVGAGVAAAKETGQVELDRLGLSRDNARDQLRTLVEGLVQAASTTGQAALSAASSGTKPAA